MTSTLFRSPAKIICVSLGVFSAAVGCTRETSKRTHTPDAARVIESGIKKTEPQKKSLESNAKVALQEAFRQAFQDKFSAASLDAATSAKMVEVASFGAADAVVNDLSRNSSKCSFDPTAITAWSKCVVKEVLTDDLSSADGLRSLMLSALTEENAKVLGNLKDLRTLISSLSTEQLEKLARNLSTSENIQKVVDQVATSVEALRNTASLIANRGAFVDVPFLAKSFFAGRTFVFTTSLQQASVGTLRVYNVNDQIVTLEVNAGRLIVRRVKNEMYNGSNGVDMIAASYPILATVDTPDGDTYFQVDFSKPENKKFLIPAFVGDNPAVDISADVVIPRIDHTQKAKKKELDSGIYFNSSDTNLVVNQLILVNSNSPLIDGDEKNDPREIGRSALHPSVQISQGLFLIDDTSKAFEEKQMLASSDAASTLFSKGNIEYRSQDYPYFLANGYLAGKPEFDAQVRQSVRKYNTEKKTTFVLSGNTPKIAVPVVKSAVYSYQRLFEKLAPAGQKPATFEVLTQEEFEKANANDGLRFSGKVDAADPRVNMIFWEDNPDFGAAWATAAANPKTGEIISADVMMSGTLWGEAGCEAFYTRKWAKRTKGRISPLPNVADVAMMKNMCRMKLWGMGFLTPGNATQVAAFKKIDDKRFLNAIEVADSKALRQLAENAGVQLNDLHMDPNALQQRIDAFQREAQKRFPATLADARKQSEQTQHQLGMDAHGHTQTAKPSVELALGNNKVHANVDCVLSALDAEAPLGLTDADVPGFSTEFVNTPEEAALAMVRSVVVHELGHTFGLRHNFAGSLATASLAADANPPFPVAKRTDSIMDYNDYGIDLDTGHMKDYTVATGAGELPDFGLYDVYALSNIYNLDPSAFKLEGKPVFCSDGDVSFRGECQRYDFGRNYEDFLLMQLNLTFQHLKQAIDADFTFEEAGSMFMRYLGKHSELSQQLWINWAVDQAVAQSKGGYDRTGGLASAVKVFHGKGDFSLDFFKRYEEKYGMKPFGLRQTLDVDAATFAYDPEAKPGNHIRATLAELYRKNSLSAFANTAPVFAQVPEMAGMPEKGKIEPVSDVGIDPDTQFRSNLLNRFASAVMIPANTPLSYSIFAQDGTGRKPGDNIKDCHGNPVPFLINVPLFNQKDQFVTQQISYAKNCDNPDSPVMETLFATAGGKYEVSELLLNMIDAAQLQPGFKYSVAYNRLAADAKFLESLINGPTPAYTLSKDAAPAAAYTLSFYGLVFEELFKPR